MGGPEYSDPGVVSATPAQIQFFFVWSKLVLLILEFLHNRQKTENSHTRTIEY
jgi:hypothetical protein